MSFFNECDNGKQDIQGLTTIQIDVLRFQYDGDGARTPADFYTSNVSVDVKSTVRQTIKNVDLIGKRRQGEPVERPTHPPPGNEIPQEHPALEQCKGELGGEVRIVVS